MKDRELEESEERHMMEVDNTYCTVHTVQDILYYKDIKSEILKT